MQRRVAVDHFDLGQQSHLARPEMGAGRRPRLSGRLLHLRFCRAEEIQFHLRPRLRERAGHRNVCPDEARSVLVRGQGSGGARRHRPRRARLNGHALAAGERDALQSAGDRRRPDRRHPRRTAGAPGVRKAAARRELPAHAVICRERRAELRLGALPPQQSVRLRSI